MKISPKKSSLFVLLACVGTLLLSSKAQTQTTPINMILEGATAAQLKALQNNLAKGAYGTDGKSKDQVSPGPASRATEVTSEDACDSFYMPRPKFRPLKALPAADPCLEFNTTVLADTDLQVIFLCKEGKTVADYDFSMGRSGTGKTTLGDLKTPLGKYPLAKPYKSDKFKVFIPIGYPTAAQSQAGMTGSDVGIHGPARPFRCIGFLNTVVNWTQGCMAVASDTFVKEIGRFVQTNNVREITISPVPNQTSEWK